MSKNKYYMLSGMISGTLLWISSSAIVSVFPEWIIVLILIGMIVAEAALVVFLYKKIIKIEMLRMKKILLFDYGFFFLTFVVFLFYAMSPLPPVIPRLEEDYPALGFGILLYNQIFLLISFLVRIFLYICNKHHRKDTNQSGDDPRL